MIQRLRQNRSLVRNAVYSLAMIVSCTWLTMGTPTVGLADMKFDSNSLPEHVDAMRNAILDAAETGNIDEMRIPIELNEIPPLINGSAEGDPVSLLRQISPDTDGAEVLAGILEILAMPAVRSADGQTFTWPYLATRDLRLAKPMEKVDLFRLIPGTDAKQMLKSGKYSYFRLEIGADGTWHTFQIGQ